MTKRLHRTTLSVILSLVLGFLAAGSADAQIRFGGQLNVADDTDFGLGPRVAVDLQELGPRFQALGTWDIYFPDGDVDFWELNANLVYRFDLPESDVVVPYVGGGLNVAHAEIDTPGGGEADETDLGLNVLGGVEFPLVSFTPFLEVRRAIDGGEQFYLTGGVMVP